MGHLFDLIRRLVGEEKYVIGEHASERLEERDINLRQSGVAKLVTVHFFDRD